MENNLKPCPLCGQNAKLCEPTTHYSYRVACIKCRCNTGGYETKLEAVEAWNRRFSCDT